MSRVHEDLANLRQATIRARPLRGGRFPFGSISLDDLRELVKATENYSGRSRVDMRSNRLSVTDATPEPQPVDRGEWLEARRESAARLCSATGSVTETGGPEGTWTTRTPREHSCNRPELPGRGMAPSPSDPQSGDEWECNECHRRWEVWWTGIGGLNWAAVRD